jgi:hypothetical protein
LGKTPKSICNVLIPGWRFLDFGQTPKIGRREGVQAGVANRPEKKRSLRKAFGIQAGKPRRAVLPPPG